MLAKEDIDDLLQRNGNVVATDGDKIGSIGQVYADDDNGQPTWVTVKTGLFGTSESFVPLEGARIEGGDIVIPYTKDQVKDAPRVDTDGHLEPSEEDRLYAHYGLGGGALTYTEATTGRDTDYDGTGRDAGVAAAGRARLRKYVTTENVTQTVPVQREELRIEREPITDDVTVDEEVRKERIETDGDDGSRR
ncbi:hypothetical protein QFZ79_000785 [Arthrobacter sp. V4I6]|uniref:DUF2382 domain-containing protein n=1 Tax=unclassified Arthrobacter TaxID=235627 RepID=UPI0027828795|nr:MULTISPECIES: DUF2382 domain-containing protein [unclassified Arthrobacter]MDQ0823042.1 hypothetical protein [Arthrobacter sp. V1I7]MDQ0852674.1 hypothetical protein [Arthrobacter sp. V4I6]